MLVVFVDWVWPKPENKDWFPVVLLPNPNEGVAAVVDVPKPLKEPKPVEVVVAVVPNPPKP